MATEPPEYHPIITTASSSMPTIITTTAAAAESSIAIAPPQTTTAAIAAVTTTTTQPNNNPGPPPLLARKRQRRPSVRLGEIGDQPASLDRIRTKNGNSFSSWSSKDQSKSVRNRSLTNLVNGNDNDNDVDDDDSYYDDEDYNNRKPFKSKRVSAATTTKRVVRSSWGNHNNKNSDDRVFDQDYSQSPVHSDDNVALDFRPVSGSDNDNDNDNVYADEMGNVSKWEGVRTWLIELGLSRYAPVFEIHEVDDEVLPMLTLEDLKDMGINAVGSRRKLYAAIQKLPHKGFS